MPDYSPGPWFYVPDNRGHGNCAIIGDANGAQVIDADFGLRISPENARRIVASVNYCLGLPTEYLENGVAKSRKEDQH